MTKYAVIAVDCQLDFLPDGPVGFPGSDRIIAHLIGYMPDLYIASRNLQTEGDYCLKGSKGARLHPEIARRADYVVTKHGISAFEGGTLRPIKSLESILEEQKIQRVYVGGYFLEGAVSQTAFDANALGYDTVVDLAISQSIPKHRPISGVRVLAHDHMIAMLEKAGILVVQ